VVCTYCTQRKSLLFILLLCLLLRCCPPSDHKSHAPAIAPAGVGARPRVAQEPSAGWLVGGVQFLEQKRARTPPPLPLRAVELRPWVFRLDAHAPRSLNTALIPGLGV
jgi:hypothetical protein